MVDEKTKTVGTLFVMGIIFFLFSGQITAYLTKDLGTLAFLISPLIQVIGVALGYVLGIIFLFFGIIALFLDIKNYGTFMKYFLVGLIILIIPIPVPWENVMSIALMGVGIQQSTKPKKDQLIQL